MITEIILKFTVLYNVKRVISKAVVEEWMHLSLYIKHIINQYYDIGIKIKKLK